MYARFADTVDIFRALLCCCFFFRLLDLSFNGIRHIKNVEHLVKLIDLYFVSNKITVIENLSTLVNVTNLELGSNRIRV